MINRTNAQNQRRRLLKGLGGLGLCLALRPGLGMTGPGLITRSIGAKRERLPAIGMGSWITFDVGTDSNARRYRVEVLRAFFEAGGMLIDSSPMYGSAQAVIGYCLDELGPDPGLFSATKVWVPGRDRGIHQIEFSRQLWGVNRFDLLQIHNMLDWKTHLPTLLAMQEQKKLRYIGITTSHGRRHSELLAVIRNQPFDFVQLSYNILEREAENRLLPMAAERGLAVIINRPFGTGALFRHVRGQALPPWAGEIDCDNWAQFFLKFVISHPAVTTAIPATSRVDHMRENMGAGYGRLPNPGQRQRMARYVAGL